MTAENFMNTVDKLESNDEYSLSGPEKQALSSIDKAAFKKDKKDWVDYFKSKMVAIGDKGQKVSVDTIARGLEIKQNPKNPNRPIVTYGKNKIARGSELAALIQVHAMTTSMAGLKRFRIDGKIGKETATALRGKNSKGEYNSEVSGVKNIREKQEKRYAYNLKNGIDKCGRKLLTGNPLVDWLINKNEMTFSAQVDENNSTVTIVQSGKTEYKQKIGDNSKFLDSTGNFNQNVFKRYIASLYVNQAIKTVDKRIEELNGRIEPLSRMKKLRNIHEMLKNTVVLMEIQGYKKTVDDIKWEAYKASQYANVSNQPIKDGSRKVWEGKGKSIS